MENSISKIARQIHKNEPQSKTNKKIIEGSAEMKTNSVLQGFSVDDG